MRRLWTILIAALLFAPPAPGAGEEPQQRAQAEYLDSCAPCHGREGRGDGPLAGQLMQPPTDLTVLSAKNDGEFPFWRVFAVIDGRWTVPAHGSRDMPVWGRQFLGAEVARRGPRGGEAAARERISELAAYVRSLQR